MQASRQLDPRGNARQLDGYLRAVSALKDDGTALSCSYLGPVAPQDALPAVCAALALSPEGLSLPPLHTVACTGAACTPRQWLLERLRPMTPADRQPLDPRLSDGFDSELFEIFDGAPHWHRLVQDGSRSLAAQLGAIWSVYVFGVADHAYLLHCSWDS